MRYAYAATAAKSLQSCPILCNPRDGSPPGSPVPGILQARTLEWVAISFSNAWKWKVKVKSFSHVWLLATPWTAAYQAPPSMGFSRQEYWSGVPWPFPESRSVVSNSFWLHGLYSPWNSPGQYTGHLNWIGPTKILQKTHISCLSLITSAKLLFYHVREYIHGLQELESDMFGSLLFCLPHIISNYFHWCISVATIGNLYENFKVYYSCHDMGPCIVNKTWIVFKKTWVKKHHPKNYCIESLYAFSLRLCQM